MTFYPAAYVELDLEAQQGGMDEEPQEEWDHQDVGGLLPFSGVVLRQ